MCRGGLALRARLHPAHPACMIDSDSCLRATFQSVASLPFPSLFRVDAFLETPGPPTPWYCSVLARPPPRSSANPSQSIFGGCGRVQRAGCVPPCGVDIVNLLGLKYIQESPGHCRRVAAQSARRLSPSLARSHTRAQQVRAYRQAGGRAECVRHATGTAQENSSKGQVRHRLATRCCSAGTQTAVGRLQGVSRTSLASLSRSSPTCTTSVQRQSTGDLCHLSISLLRTTAASTEQWSLAGPLPASHLLLLPRSPSLRPLRPRQHHRSASTPTPLPLSTAERFSQAGLLGRNTGPVASLRGQRH